MALDWQTAAVIAIEALAIAFLVHRIAFGRRAPSRPATKPDVAAGSLVRRKR